MWIRFLTRFMRSCRTPNADSKTRETSLCSTAFTSLDMVYLLMAAILKRHLEKQKPNDLQKVLRFSSFCCMNHDFQTLVVLWQTFGCFKSERLDVVQHLLKHCRMHLEWISPRKEDKKIVSLFNLYLVKLHQVNVRDLPPDLTKQLLDLLASMCDILLTTSHQTRLLVTKNIKILVSGFGNIDLLLDLKRSDTSRLWLASVLVNDAYTLQQTLKLVENSDPNAFYDTMDEHIITCLAQRVQLPSWREQEWWQILFNNVHPCVPEWMGLQLQMKVKRGTVTDSRRCLSNSV
ncbi:hypothetical protein EDD86DRAFT_137033 [Gorgonomyces haynaldii]|nr:hypothetical protein EDD86DRAFT_137033 [Gorgonomyces haynaldii]